jgi:hypothetical protein
VAALLFALAAVALACPPDGFSASGGHATPAHVGEHGEVVQWARFPVPLSQYGDGDVARIQDKLASRIAKDPFNLVATAIFFCAILHTFFAGFFLKLAHKLEYRHREKIEREGRTANAKPHHNAIDDVSLGSQVCHFLGEIEAIFGIWVVALAAAAAWFYGFGEFRVYVAKDVNFTEPVFVVVIMAIASSRPVIRLAEQSLAALARLGGGTAAAWWWSILTAAPLLGSFITEPAAMTIAALLLGKKFYQLRPSAAFAYATLGLLFVNISVGGTLTHFAAPPVLMVAGPWGWDMPFMAFHFGWKATAGILAANLVYYAAFRRQLAAMPRPDSVADSKDGPPHWEERDDPVPAWITGVHVLFLAWTVSNAHYAALVVGGFLFFLAFVVATEHHQNRVSLRGPLLVGFFLAGLVIHGGCQRWWIEPILTGITNEWVLMLGATGLTAFNDNAAITYLASQAPGLTDAAKYAVVAGAVTGGGLTVIANAPNPAGQSILSKHFPGGIAPLNLFLGAALPTAIMVFAFMAIVR